MQSMKKGARKRSFFSSRKLITKTKIANYEVGKVDGEKHEEKGKKFFEGFPPVPGWYHCRLEGGETELYCKRCELTMKMRWIYNDGSPVEEHVEWTTP